MIFTKSLMFSALIIKLIKVKTCFNEDKSCIYCSFLCEIYFTLLRLQFSVKKEKIEWSC